MNRSTFQSVLMNKMEIYFGESLFEKNAIEKPRIRISPGPCIFCVYSLIKRDFVPLDLRDVLHVLAGGITHLVKFVQSFIIVAGGISALISR